jgi:phosphatidate cytidylyltransferase
MLFKELVNVRYKAAMEKKIPLFRTLQWAWFIVAIFYTYGDSTNEYLKDHPKLNGKMWQRYNAWHPLISLLMYSSVFMISVLTLRNGLYRYQVGDFTRLRWGLPSPPKGLSLSDLSLRPAVSRLGSWRGRSSSCV